MEGGDRTIVRTAAEAGQEGALPGDLFVSLEVIEGPDKGMRVNLTKTKHLLGRSSGDIQFNDPTVSGVHAAMEYVAGELMIADQNSSNGTLVNGKEVSRGPVENMDEIKLGNTKLLLSVVKDVYGTYMTEETAEMIEEPEEVDPNALTQPRRQIPNPEVPKDVRVILQVIEGPDTGKKFLLKNQSTLIGRDEHADVRLNDGSVSRRHCQIQVINRKTMGIKDLVSMNGTILNERFISSFKIKNKDVVQLGDTKLQIYVMLSEQGPS